MYQKNLNPLFNSSTTRNTFQAFRLFLLIFVVFMFGNAVCGQTIRTSTGSADWNSASTWSPSGVPGLLDPVIIRPGDVVTVNTTPANAVASVTFNNTSAAASGLAVASGAILTVTGAVSLLNSATASTSASISGSGTLLCGSLNIGVPAVTTTNFTSLNTFTLSIKTLTVSGNITSNNDDPGGKASQPVLNINSPCTLSANSVVFTHTGTAAGGKTISTFNLGSGATLNLSAAVPIVVNYNVFLTSSMVTVNFPLGSTVNLCGASPAPTSITNTGSGGTDTPIGITYNGAINTGGGSLTLTSGSGTNVVSTPTNIAMASITYSTTAATGATFSGLPPGVTGLWSGGVVTLSGTPTTVGVYNYTVTTVGSGSCGGKIANGTITTYVCPTFSLLSTSTSSVNVCVGSSSLITLTANAANLPVGNYAVTYNIQGVDQADATMTVTTAGIGSFVYTGFTSAGDRTVTITKITSGLCSSVISANNMDTITVVAVLAAPTALAGSGATCTQMTANWNALPGVTYYELDVSASNTFATLLTGYNALNVGLVTTYNITGLSSSTTYYYRVRAFNGNCISASSSTSTYATIVLPGTVTSNAATLVICDGFTANWTATANATSYLLDVSTSSTFVAGFFVGVYNAYDVGNSTTISLSGLNANTVYYYRVKAKNGCGNSASFSVTRNLTTANAVPVTVTSNAATLVICNGFTANWTATANATSYLLDVSTSSTFAAGFFVGVYNAYDVGNSTTISLSGLNANTLYYYRVKAKNGCGNSASFSTTITTTTSSSPSTPTISTTGALTFCENNSVTLGATSGGASYDWYLNGSLISTETTGFLFVITAGSYTVKLKNASGCQSSVSTASIIVVEGLPKATAGGSQSICSNATATVNGATASNGTIAWTENGTGSITSGATTLTPTYTSAAGDIGNTVTLTMMVTSNNTCTPQTATATYTITVFALPIITTQPINQLDCEGNIVSFNVVASGVDLTYVWQRKLPAEASFSNIPSEANVSYPTPDKIRIQSIGSSLSLNGTQYQVVVSNGACSLKSSVATLSVNEITGVSPTATTVTQCYGTNYSYTVSTSYPSNVVSYQWKSSVASGVWNDVVNGAHFSGATTATLNIINGTPTESAEYRVYITFHSSGADCNVTSASRTRTLTFLPLLLTPATVITQPTCSLATGTITVTIQSSTDTYSFDNGISYQASNIKSGLATGNRNVIIKNSGGCVSVSTLTTIDVQPATPVQPILSAASQPTCAVPGSFSISNYNATYTYTVSPNIGVDISGNLATATAGSYTLIATLGTCASIASSSVTITPLVTNTWTTTGWSTGVAPTNNSIVVIDNDYNTSTNGNINACSVFVNTGKKVTITANNYAIIQNDLTVNGALEVLDQGSLVMVNDAGNVVNNGTTTVHRVTSQFEKYDYVYWSTPVGSSNISSTFPNWRTSFAYEFLPANFLDVNPVDGFDDDGNTWSFASTMLPGKGYIIMTPTNKLTYPALEEVIFSGKVNNGVVTTPIVLTPSVASDDDFNLVGNPYPSAISSDAFINANINTITGLSYTIEGTLYFWTHVGDVSAANIGPDALNYSANDYAIENLSGGTKAGSGGTMPSGFIASGQGFFVEAHDPGMLVFNNAMRVGTETQNNQFYKTTPDRKRTSKTSNDRFWLNLENSSKMFSQQLIGYFNNATLDYDNGYDGPANDAGNYVNFYSFIDNDRYKIQGRSSFNQDDQVRLGYFSAVAGTFNINIDSKEGVFENTNQAVFLEDKLTKTTFDLKSGSYTFTTDSGTFDDRFVLKYTDKTLGKPDFGISKKKVLVSVKNSQIIINSFNETIDKVTIYELLGRKLSQKRNVNSNELLIANLFSSHQTLVVKTVLKNGMTYTDKIMY